MGRPGGATNSPFEAVLNIERLCFLFSRKGGYTTTTFFLAAFVDKHLHFFSHPSSSCRSLVPFTLYNLFLSTLVHPRTHHFAHRYYFSFYFFFIIPFIKSYIITQALDASHLEKGYDGPSPGSAFTASFCVCTHPHTPHPHRSLHVRKKKTKVRVGAFDFAPAATSPFSPSTILRVGGCSGGGRKEWKGT
ncbi:hypothetical protein TRV_04860 [Trichophyton verrucosum HKI 0517]|uniref:Uncharacterized protein n=1 Tax=Trichophyton verrucosum (strain HKI 0517) TaxID=663202 RepID=D4DCK5_TRIVH|nr:uncharacterized protein TRV_04860 [Trichophyton verrucosum HKI 0517]EFE40377.1 hypothetical protein TRV_04860 [Trichophyton verrucosum HKI 0517]